MGGLSIKPDGVVQGPKLSEMARNEVGPKEVKVKKKKTKEEEKKTMSLCCLEIDASYVRTIPGFLRLVQVLLLVVGTICLISISNWSFAAGVYAIYCIILLSAAVTGAYLLLTKLTGNRTTECCGFSWVFLEFLNFAIFGFLVFVGACMTAANSDGSSGLNGAVAFGFFAVITYVYLIWHSWGAYKKLDSDEDEKKSVRSEEDVEKNEEEIITDEPMHAELDIIEERKMPRDSQIKNRSLPADLSHLYENTQPFSHHRSSHRKRHSLSEKDSAYSEGEEHMRDAPLQRRKSSHKSATIEGVLSRQPLAHMSHRPYSRRVEGMSVDGRDSLGRSTIGYPSMVSEHFPSDKPKFDDLHKSKRQQRGGGGGGQQRGSKPDWLKAALGEDTPNPNHIIDTEECYLDDNRRFSTIDCDRREFPLLNDSAEESVCYPSISQQQQSRNARIIPNPMRRSQRRPSKHYRHRSHGNERQVSGGGGGGRLGGKHASGHRHRHHGRSLGHHHRHHHHRHGESGHRQHSHGNGNWQRNAAPTRNANNFSRRPVDGAHEDYLRQMMGNDELVNRDGPRASFRAAKLHDQAARHKNGGEHHHGLEDTRSTSPVPNGMDNPVMQKYFSNMK